MISKRGQSTSRPLAPFLARSSECTIAMETPPLPAMSTSLSYIRVPETTLNEALYSPMPVASLFLSDALAEDKRFDPGPTYCLINFLLTGTCWEGKAPLSHLMFGAQTIERAKAEGTFRYARPDQVRAAWLAVEPLSPEELWKTFDLAAFENGDPWPPGWTKSEDDRAFFFEKFTAVKSFYKQATANGEAVILWIN
jgi:hypothetical protein